MNIHQQQELGPSDSPSLVKTGLAEYTGEWKPTRLGDIASFFKGSGLSKTDLSLDGKRRCIHYGELFTAYGEHITNVLHGTDTEGVFFCSVRNDVLMPTSDVTPNGLATASCILVSNVIIGGDVLVIRAPKELLNGEFLAYAIKMNRNQVMQLVSGTTVFHLNGRDMANFRFTVPGAREQRAIVAALSDVVGLLDVLEALISKKRAIKQTTMQQLLTGKTRLPGFDGQWDKKRLGEIGTFSKGHSVKREDVSNVGLPCVLYGELYTRYINHTMELTSRVPRDVAESALPIKKGDLLFAGSGETTEEIGRCTAYLGDESAYAGGDIIVLTPSGQNPIYLGHLMNHPIVAAQKARMGQGNAVVHISTRNLAQVQLSFPSYEEQSAISAILFDMTAEISALKRRLEKTLAIKQGMMQQLLTGQVRLIESGTGP